MRVTRETLLKLAQDTVARRTRGDRNLVAAYLCGSLQGEEYQLGGAADIDLVFIHVDAPAAPREIVHMSDEIHLDIAHHDQKEYRHARQLRVHPWIGPTINDCVPLHDPQHFMDFTQASVRGQFDRPDYIYERARQLAEKAREIWTSLQMEQAEPGPQEVLSYLRAVGSAVNAIAGLSGPPLTERRFLIHFPERAEAIGKPGLHAGLLGLLGAPKLGRDSLAGWLPFWQNAFQAVPANKAPARLHPDRRLYYQHAFEAMLGNPRPEVMLWPLLRTWTMAISLLQANSEHYDAWQEAFAHLGLQGVGFTERVEALDAYLDLVEETLETWARENGGWVE